MKSRRLRFSGRRLTAGLAAAALAATGVVLASSASASADPVVLAPVSKNFTYRCTFPLVGAQDVAATVNVTFPDTGSAGNRVVMGDLKIDVTLSANIVNALRSFQTATTEGTAVADVDTAFAGKNITLGIPGLTIAKRSLPASGPMTTTISGPVPSVIVYQSGSLALAAGTQFNAKVDTRKADGTPTALGVLNVPCSVKATTPPQDRSLATIPIAASPQAEAVRQAAGGVAPLAVVDKNLTYSCTFPEAGVQDVTGRVQATIPDATTVNTRTQVTGVSITAAVPSAVADTLRANSAATVGGRSTVDVDQVYNGTKFTIGMPSGVPSAAVPASGGFNISINPAVPSLAVTAAGTVSLAAGQQLNSTFTPLKADGTPTALGTFAVPCTLKAGQDPALSTITVS